MARILLLAAACLGAAAPGRQYRVSVTRVDQDLYRDSLTDTVIQTRFCHAFATAEDAILTYEPYSYENKLTFQNGTACEVVSLYRPYR